MFYKGRSLQFSFGRKEQGMVTRIVVSGRFFRFTATDVSQHKRALMSSYAQFSHSLRIQIPYASNDFDSNGFDSNGFDSS